MELNCIFIRCEKPAKYVVNGSSLCEEHLEVMRKQAEEQQLMQIANSLKKIKDVATRNAIRKDINA